MTPKRYENMQLCNGFDCSEGVVPRKAIELNGKYYCELCLPYELRKELAEARVIDNKGVQHSTECARQARNLKALKETYRICDEVRQELLEEREKLQRMERTLKQINIKLQEENEELRVLLTQEQQRGKELRAELDKVERKYSNKDLAHEARQSERDHAERELRNLKGAIEQEGYEIRGDLHEHKSIKLVGRRKQQQTIVELRVADKKAAQLAAASARQVDALKNIRKSCVDFNSASSDWKGAGFNAITTIEKELKKVGL